MLASLDDRLKIIDLVQKACKKNRLLYWLCNHVIRNIHITGNMDIDMSGELTDMETAILMLWMKDMVDNLPYLRLITDKTQMCEIMLLKRHENVSEAVFSQLSESVDYWVGEPYNDAQKWYRSAIDIILNEEVDSETRDKMKTMITSKEFLEETLESIFNFYHNYDDGTTYTMYYKDPYIEIDENTYSDTTLSIWNAAVEVALQLIINLVARIYVGVELHIIFDTNASVKPKIEQLEALMETVKGFDYLTPTTKRNVLVGGGVIYVDRNF